MNEKGQAGVVLILVFAVLGAAAFCALSGVALQTDPDGNAVVGRPADFANATAIAKGADLARQSTQVAVNSIATRSAAGSQATATAAAVAIAATSTSIAQVANATATAVPFQSGIAQSQAHTAIVNNWTAAAAAILWSLVLMLGALAVVALVRKRATSLYPNAAGQYPVKIERHGNVITMHDPNRGMGPASIYVAPGLLERTTWMIMTLRGAQLPMPQPAAVFPQTGDEGAMLQIATQAQAGQVAAAQNRWPILPQNVAGRMTLSGGDRGGVERAATTDKQRMPSIRVIDDREQIDKMERLLLREGL